MGLEGRDKGKTGVGGGQSWQVSSWGRRWPDAVYVKIPLASWGCRQTAGQNRRTIWEEAFICTQARDPGAWMNRQSRGC